MADDILYKRPNEKISYDYDFTPKLQSDASLTSPTVTAIDEEGQSATSTIVASSSASGLTLTGVLQGGTDGKDYLVTYKATGNVSGDIREWVLELRVRTYLQGVV